MYYIYIIQSQSTLKYYIGYSSNPWKRLHEHNTECKDKYTGKYADWELKVIFTVSENKSEALKIERFIKNQKNKALLEKLINPQFKPNRNLAQLVRVPHVRD